MNPYKKEVFFRWKEYGASCMKVIQDKEDKYVVKYYYDKYENILDLIRSVIYRREGPIMVLGSIPEVIYRRNSKIKQNFI